MAFSPEQQGPIMIRNTTLSAFATMAAVGILTMAGCTPSADQPDVETPVVRAEQVPRYQDLVHNEEKWKAALLKCKELPTYQAQLDSEWCAITRKALECEQKRICPEK